MKITGYISQPEKNLYMQSVTPFESKKGDFGESAILGVITQLERQTLLGFGGAFTEAAGYCFDKLSEDEKKKFIKEYFSEDGLNYSFCRTHIGSCDFSLGNYDYSEKPDLSDFDISRDENYLIPLIKAALNERKNLPTNILASPWSPPPYMKDTRRKNRGGKLEKEYYGIWADYIVRYLEEYDKKGIYIWGVTAQNEPKATLPWDTCVFTPEEEGDFIFGYLAPALKKIDRKVMFWDHNKDRIVERAEAVLKRGGADNLFGIACHWYTGDHFGQISAFREIYPNLLVIPTECCNRFGGGMYLLDNAERYAHDIIGDINAGASAYIDWNILLDENGGPNHVNNVCEAPVMSQNDGKASYKPAFYYIGHFSRFIKPNAKVVATSRYTDKLEILAAKNPDGKYVAVILNRGNEDLPFTLRINGENAESVAPRHSLQTLIIE